MKLIERTRLVALKQWARELGVPYTTIHDVALRGEFPIIRIGRAIYLERDDGDRFIEAQKERTQHEMRSAKELVCLRRGKEALVQAEKALAGKRVRGAPRSRQKA